MIEKHALAILRERPTFAQRVGNRARANAWLQGGPFIRSPWWSCAECGGWYLIRKDEEAHIEVHFRGCSKICPVCGALRTSAFAINGVRDMLKDYIFLDELTKPVELDCLACRIHYSLKTIRENE